MQDLDKAIFLFAAIVLVVLLLGLGTLAYLTWVGIAWLGGVVL